MKLARLATVGLCALVMITVMEACRSGKAALEHGRYYEAVIESVNRLRRNSDHKKSIETLREAYPMAKRYHEDQANAALASTGDFKWSGAVEQYTLLQNMYDEIMRAPAALKIIPDPTNYSAKLAEARQKAAEENYMAGANALAAGDRVNAKKAYYLFINCNKYVAGYKDVQKKIEEAKWAATLKVAVEPIPAIARNYAVSAEYFDNKLNEYLKSGSVNEFVRFYTPAEVSAQKINPDHIVKLTFDEFSVGQVYVNEKELQPEKDSVVIAYSFTDSKGVVQRKDTEASRVVPSTNTGSTASTGGNTTTVNNNTTTTNTSNTTVTNNTTVNNTTNNNSTSTTTTPVNNSPGNSGSAGQGNSGNSNGNSQAAAQQEKKEEKKEEKAEQKEEKKEDKAEQKDQKADEKADKKEDKSEQKQDKKDDKADQKDDKSIQKEEKKEDKGDAKQDKKDDNSDKQSGNKNDDKNASKDDKTDKTPDQKNDDKKNDQQGGKTDTKDDAKQNDKSVGEKKDPNEGKGTDNNSGQKPEDKGDKKSDDKKDQKEEKNSDNTGVQKQEDKKDDKKQDDKQSGGDKSDAKEEQVTICHQPPGNPNERKTMTVPKSAVQAHLNHGDVVGECTKAEEKKSEEKKSEEKKSEEKKSEEKKDDKGKKKGDGDDAAGMAMISWPNSRPVMIASAGSRDKMWMYFTDETAPLDTTKIYGKVKASVRQYKKTVTSKGVLNVRIVDARTKAVLSEQRIPGEYIWSNEWLTYNGDSRALTADQLKLAKQKEQLPPSNQDLFKAFIQPIFDQVSVKIKEFYRTF